MLIAIDGPAASGKGTVAKQIAAHFGLEYLDTGRLYRLVGCELLRKLEVGGANLEKTSGKSQNDSHPGLDPGSSRLSSAQLDCGSEAAMTKMAIEIAENLDTSEINSEELETEEVGRAASIVSAIPEVRAALLDFQRRVASSPKGAVLDGRDIGTVICPNADFKFYITAAAEARAKRRYLQLKAKGKKVNEAEILKDILARDERDSNRSVAPLLPAIDAVYIDTSEMTANAVFEMVKEIVSRN